MSHKEPNWRPLWFPSELLDERVRSLADLIGWSQTSDAFQTGGKVYLGYFSLLVRMQMKVVWDLEFIINFVLKILETGISLFWLKIWKKMLSEAKLKARSTASRPNYLLSKIFY